LKIVVKIDAYFDLLVLLRDTSELFNMKYITAIIKKLIPKELPKPIGRWRIENCSNTLNSKIDLSNEDHCGPCGQYALEKIDLKHSDKKPDINVEKLK